MASEPHNGLNAIEAKRKATESEANRKRREAAEGNKNAVKDKPKTVVVPKEQALFSDPKTEAARAPGRSERAKAANVSPSTLDAAIERGEVKQIRDGSRQVFQVGIQDVPVAEVDRWRKHGCEIYERQAKERQGSNQHKSKVENLPPCEVGKARDAAGKAFGVSGKSPSSNVEGHADHSAEKKTFVMMEDFLTQCPLVSL